MEWNDGKERAKFEREQKELREEYVAAGMSETQIQEMRKYDEAWYRSRRREARHTQRLNVTAFDEDDGDNADKNPLLKKFLHSISTEDKYFENDRFGWIEQIEDKGIYKAVKTLSDTEKEILTELVCEGLTQTEIALCIGRNQSNICRKIARMRKILKSSCKSA